jgi:glycosyltransferase involved in cell wall biosynthesis
MSSKKNIDVLWLRPSTGENVSTRRERIAEQLGEMGVKVDIVNTSGTDSLSAVWTAITGNYDIIVGTVRVGLHIGYFLSRILRVPFIGSVSDPLERQKDDVPPSIYRLMCFLEWRVLRWSDAVFFVHPESHEDAKERGIDGTLARNAVNYSMFADPEEETKTKALEELTKNNVDTTKDIAIYIGGMVENAHLEEIVEAAQMTPDWEFVFVGKEWGANISELVSDVENAYFLGAYNHEIMPGFLRHSSAAFCLVDNEVPLKVTEYGAAGLPTLGYPGKLKHVFSENELIYIEPKPEKISEELQKIASDPEYAQKYANNLRDYAAENKWEDIAEKYYKSIVELTG